MRNPIADHEWLEANLAPSGASERLGIQIPDLPSDEVQVRFTGRTGRANLQQAFDFYKFVLQHVPRNGVGHVVDFGGGWGRVLRFFLREYSPDRLVLFDCLTDAIECARSLRPPFRVELTGTLPPLPLENDSADLFYAFSVLSHLSEHACSAWLAHMAERLVQGGVAVITTRGKMQIDHIAYLRRQRPIGSRLDKFLRRKGLLTFLPSTEAIARRYEEGQFQFYPTGGGGELSDEFYGEAWVPEKWFQDRHAALGFSSYQFFPEFGTVDQCVVVLTK